jgi:hypothetical protein
LIGRATEAIAGAGAFAVWAYLIVATLLWLVFFPNSVYLITELNFSHRAETTPVPLWYDIVQTLALTLSGIAGPQPGRRADDGPRSHRSPDGRIPAASWGFAATVILLGAIGVYLGRYLRLNSWDIRHPGSMIRKLGAHLRQRGRLWRRSASSLPRQRSSASSTSRCSPRLVRVARDL